MTLIICSDWLTHQHRDTLASIVGHPTLTSYLAIADGESIGRVKFEMTEVGLFLLPIVQLMNPFCLSVCSSHAVLLLVKMKISIYNLECVFCVTLHVPIHVI